jgi:type IV pilus biogenesis protein CpaD/CtpE
MKRFGLACSILLLTGCASSDPYLRRDAWHPVGANAANIATMASNPRDLILGRSERQADAQEAASDIQKLWQGQPRQLLDTNSAKGGPNE